MRFVWSVVAFILATLLIGAGIAQRTIFLGPPSQEMQISVEEPTPYLLIDSEVLRANPGAQTLFIRGDGELFAAYGRTADMTAWLSDAEYNAVTLDDAGVPQTSLVEPDPVVDLEEDEATDDATDDAADETGEEAEDETAVSGRSPVGSDLWLDSFSDEDQLITDMQLPEGTSILVARDGTEAAPDDIVVSWPLDRSTPWVGPLITAGIVVLVLGIVLYILAIRHQRRGRGPLRKGPGPLPPTEPIQTAVESAAHAEEIAAAEADPAQPDDAEATPDGGPRAAGEKTAGDSASDAADAGTQTMRRHAPRRRVWALPAAVLSVALVTGCSPDSWPQPDAGTPTPSASPTVIAPDNQKPPAVTEAQAARILQSVSDTLAEADADLDIDLAATRLDGMPLETRRTDYTLRAQLPDRTPPATIPTGDIEVLLPQATGGWPRTVLVLAQSKGEETVPPVILTMTQSDPWSNYRITALAEMQAKAEVPDLAPAWLGTTLITESAAAFLTMPPPQVAEAFADLIDSGDASTHRNEFDEAALALATSIRESRQQVVQSLADNGAAETSSVAFDAAPSEDPSTALATLDSGAIISVSLLDAETITPTSEDAVIKFGENAEVKTLSGVEESAKGVTTRYALQLFFSVPAQGSSEQIRLLAVHQDILDVEVIK